MTPAWNELCLVDDLINYFSLAKYLAKYLLHYIHAQMTKLQAVFSHSQGWFHCLERPPVV